MASKRWEGVEVPPGFEPGMEVLQTSAAPNPSPRLRVISTR